MSALQRTKANGFTIEEAEDLEAPEHTLHPMDRLWICPKSITKYRAIFETEKRSIFKANTIRF